MPFSRTQSVFIFMGKCIGERVSPLKRGFNTNYYFYVSLNGTLGKCMAYVCEWWFYLLFITMPHSSRYNTLDHTGGCLSEVGR